MVPHVRPTLCQPAPASAASAWRHRASGRRLSDDQWPMPVAVVGGGSARDGARSARAPSTPSRRRKDLLPHAAHGVARRPAGHHHGSAGARWRGQAGGIAQRGTSAAAKASSIEATMLTSPPASGTGPLTRGLHAPHRVAGIIGDQQRAVRHHGEPDRPPVRLSGLGIRHEAGQKVLRWAGGLTVTERDEHDFVTRRGYAGAVR
jgi:hypothetical protein